MILTESFFLAAILFASPLQGDPVLKEEKQDEANDAVASQAKLTSLVLSIRTAYRQARDNDVLSLVDQAFLEATKSGDHSKDAELYFWRGTTYRRLGKNEQALTALEQARVLGYPGAELYLESGLAHKSLGQRQEADQDYQEGQKHLPEDMLVREHYSERWLRESRETTRFVLTVTPSIGYDSNVVGLDPNTPLTENINHFASEYEGLLIDAKWYLIRNQHQVIFLEYQGQGRQYPESNSLSYMDNVISLTGREPVLEWADFEVRAGLEEAFVNEVGHFRTERTIAPAFIFQPLHDLQVRLWGDYTNVSYYEQTTTEQDRDGNILRIGVTFPIDLHLDWSIAPYVTFDRYDAQGSDYKSHGWEGGVTLLTPVFAGFKFALTASYAIQDYNNPNSLTNFTEKRVDRPIAATLVVTFKQLEKVLGAPPSISVSWYRHESNISAFSYSRWAPQLELGITALSF